MAEDQPHRCPIEKDEIVGALEQAALDQLLADVETEASELAAFTKPWIKRVA